jgi:hypothetical protein
MRRRTSVRSFSHHAHDVAAVEDDLAAVGREEADEHLEQ